MNKQGYWLSGVVGIVLFFFILVAAIVGIATYNQGDEVGKQYLNRMKNLTWNTIQPQGDLNNTLGNAIYDTVNLVGKYSIEFSKLAADYGYTHPGVPWKILVYGILLSILAPIFYYGFLALVVIVLLINEWRLNRKEKKKLSQIISNNQVKSTQEETQ